MNKNGWQLAVVDWSLLKKNYRSIYDMIADHISWVEALPDGDPHGLKSGTVCYIVDVFYAEPFSKSFEAAASQIYGNKAAVFNLWVPSMSRYMYCLMLAVRPIVTEEDIVDVELKYPNTNICSYV